MHDSPTKPAALGFLGSILVIFGDFAKWYSANLPSINQWIIHVGQLGGLVIMCYSIMILRRNWKTGKNSKNPMEQ